MDVGGALSDAWAVKDEDEQKNLRKAAFLVSSAVNSFAVPQIEGKPLGRRGWWGGGVFRPGGS